eukprot:2424699-Pyramimonas_sp.AAC.1
MSWLSASHQPRQGPSPASPVTRNHFGRINFIVVSSSWLGFARRAWGDKFRACASNSRRGCRGRGLGRAAKEN